VAPFPAFIQPCLALPRNEVPTGRGLIHELKLDGYRVQAHIQDGRVRLYTRGGFDWTSRFATIVASLTRLPAAKLVLDGEIICAETTSSRMRVTRSIVRWFCGTRFTRTAGAPASFAATGLRFLAGDRACLEAGVLFGAGRAAEVRCPFVRTASVRSSEWAMVFILPRAPVGSKN
jgi:hypothetical protein